MPTEDYMEPNKESTFPELFKGYVKNIESHELIYNSKHRVTRFSSQEAVHSLLLRGKKRNAVFVYWNLKSFPR